MLLYSLSLSFNKKFLNFQLNSVELTVAIKVMIEDAETLKARFFLIIDDDNQTLTDQFRQYFNQVTTLIDVEALHAQVEDETVNKLNILARTLYYWIEG